MTLFFCASAPAAFCVLAGVSEAMPSFEDIKASYTKSDASLLDRHGNVIQEMRIDSKGRRLDWTSLGSISPALVKAVIWSEDRRFYEHKGVDWTAMAASVLENLFNESKRGASTITMQLASMLDSKLRPRKGRRTIGQKWDQISAALEIENSWKKDEILEAYLNLVTFRSELQGIAAASQGLFGKNPDGLNGKEAALLAALIRSPNAAPETAASRACALVEHMRLETKCDEIRSLALETLNGPYRISFKRNLAPHVARQLLSDKKRVAKSTLDGELQRFASETLARHLRALSGRNANDGAVIVVENKTGEIIAYVANAGQHSSAKHVDGIVAMRQAGSTLKPFLYELAIEKGLITAASLLDDSALNVPTQAGLYMPQNYDNDYKGLVSVRTALSSSLNIPAVRALMLVSPEAFADRLRELGFRNVREGDYYGFSLALGSIDVTLYDLVNAYRTLANGGKWSSMTIDASKRKVKSRQVMKRSSAFIISDILSDRSARSLTFGFENPLSTRYWSAVKTGTSKDMRDNWCVGFSDKYTVGVWVGNFSGAPMWNVSGISGAAPVWLDIMNYLNRRNSGGRMRQPEDVVIRRVKFENASEAERDEYFVRGTEPTAETGLVSSVDRASANIAILYPADNTIIAIDPDIPPENNMIFFEATAGGSFFWALNSEKIGYGSKIVSWRPQPGRHTLSLVDNEGKTIDSVKFEARGAPSDVAANVNDLKDCLDEKK